jgi:hypothetical protein
MQQKIVLYGDCKEVRRILQYPTPDIAYSVYTICSVLCTCIGYWLFLIVNLKNAEPEYFSWKKIDVIKYWHLQISVAETEKEPHHFWWIWYRSRNANAAPAPNLRLFIGGYVTNCKSFLFFPFTFKISVAETEKEPHHFWWFWYRSRIANAAPATTAPAPNSRFIIGG